LRRSTLLRLAPLALVLALPGCGTINSVASGCPGKYSGVQQDLDLIGAYRSSEAADSEVPIGLDGQLGNVWDLVFVAFDVPLSALTDTLAPPVTLRMATRAPEPPALGCGWAKTAPTTQETGPNPS
jgi:uncharacterized protein YceK